MMASEGRTKDERIKAVIFDAGGVLVPSISPFVKDFAAKIGLDIPSIRTVLSYKSDDTPLAQWERGEIVDVDHVDRLFSDYSYKVSGLRTDWKGFASLVHRRLQSEQPFPELINCIVQLRAAGYKTALLSNNVYFPDGTTWQLFDRKYFDVIVESAVEHIRKPDPRIFQLTLKKLEVDADAAVFLDDLHENVDSARQLGIRSILVTSPEQALKDLEAAIGFRLQS